MPSSRIARLVAAAAVVLVLFEAGALVSRGSRGQSDISVFYRTCRLLRSGVGAAIYPRNDAGTGWPISMPPVGFAIFQPLAYFDPFWSSAGWAVVNLALLGVALAGLRRTIARSGSAGLERAFPWAAPVLLALAAASIQVGQFSVLFVTCWVLFMHDYATGHRGRSAFWLSIPGAIKLYPMMLLAVPLSRIGGPRAAVRYLAGFTASVLALWLLWPALAYGRQTLALNVSWWQHVILNHAQMDYLQSLRANTNQSLDTVLLRYLSYDPEFHDAYPVPHLAIPKAAVLQVANGVRGLIALVSAAVVWRWRRGRGVSKSETNAPSTREVILLTALWSSAMYLMLPETKSRYAVYLFIAFLPWLETAAAARPASARVAHAAGLVIVLLLVVVLLPDVLQAYGIGFIGPLVLWVYDLKRMGTAEARGRPL